MNKIKIKDLGQTQPQRQQRSKAFAFISTCNASFVGSRLSSKNSRPKANCAKGYGNHNNVNQKSLEIDEMAKPSKIREHKPKDLKKGIRKRRTYFE